MMKKQILTLSFVLFLSMVGLFAEAQEVLCRLPRIHGFDKEYDEAKKLVGKTTYSPEGASVYVTVQDDSLYLQTNYQWTRDFDDNPVKCAIGIDELRKYGITADLMPLSTLVENTLFEPIPYDVYHKMPVYVNRKVIEHPGFGDMDLGFSDDVYLVEANGVKRKTRAFDGANNTSSRVVELETGVYARITARKTALLWTKLGDMPLKKERIKILSLIDDHATDEALQSAIPLDNRLILESFTKLSVDRSLKDSGENFIVVLGHFDDNSQSFQTVNSKGEVLLKISLDTFADWAKQFKVTFLPMGCKTGKLSSFGMLDEFNSVDAAKSLGDSLEAPTVASFIRGLTHSRSDVVIDETAFADAAYTARFLFSDAPTGAANKSGTLALSASAGTVFVIGAGLSDDDGPSPVVILLIIGGASTIFVLYRGHRTRRRRQAILEAIGPEGIELLREIYNNDTVSNANEGVED